MDVPEIVPLRTAEVRVLFVRVSVVARPTRVSVLVGRVIVPVLLMLLTAVVFMIYNKFALPKDSAHTLTDNG